MARNRLPAEFSGEVNQFNKQEDKLLNKRVEEISMLQNITARHLSAQIRRVQLRALKKRYISTDTFNDTVRIAEQAFIYHDTPSYVMSCSCGSCKRHWKEVPTELRSSNRKREAQRSLAWKHYSPKSTYPDTFADRDCFEDSLLDDEDLRLSLSSSSSFSSSMNISEDEDCKTDVQREAWNSPTVNLTSRHLSWSRDWTSGNASRVPPVSQIPHNMPRSMSDSEMSLRVPAANRMPPFQTASNSRGTALTISPQARLHSHPKTGHFVLRERLTKATKKLDW